MTGRTIPALALHPTNETGTFAFMSQLVHNLLFLCTLIWAGPRPVDPGRARGSEPYLLWSLSDSPPSLTWFAPHRLGTSVEVSNPDLDGFDCALGWVVVSRKNGFYPETNDRTVSHLTLSTTSHVSDRASPSFTSNPRTPARPQW